MTLGARRREGAQVHAANWIERTSFCLQQSGGPKPPARVLLISERLRNVDLNARAGFCAFADYELVVGAGLPGAEFGFLGVGNASRALLSFRSRRPRSSLVALVTLRSLTTSFALGSLLAL